MAQQILTYPLVACTDCKYCMPCPYGIDIPGVFTHITTVAKGAETIKNEKCDFVIALGGGSVMDAAKVMAVACFHEGDPWDMIFHGQENVVVPQKGLPNDF